MKVFVAFGYNDQDLWIRQFVIPLVETLGCEVVTGEDMHGQNLATGVLNLMSDSDACIGFLTRRGNQPNQDGTYPTHLWVQQELTVALSRNISVFEIRESGIDTQNGILGDRQRFEYQNNDRHKVLLEVAKFIMKEKPKHSGKIFIMAPPEIISEIHPFFVNSNIKCRYRFMVKTRQTSFVDTTIERFGGGLGIVVRNIPDDDASIEIVLEGPSGNNWSSGFISVGSINVQIKRY